MVGFTHEVELPDLLTHNSHHNKWNPLIKELQRAVSQCFFWFLFFIILSRFSSTYHCKRGQNKHTFSQGPLHLHTLPHSHTGSCPEQTHSSSAAAQQPRSNWRWDILLKGTLTDYFFSSLYLKKRLLLNLTWTLPTSPRIGTVQNLQPSAASYCGRNWLCSNVTACLCHNETFDSKNHQNVMWQTEDASVIYIVTALSLLKNSCGAVWSIVFILEQVFEWFFKIPVWMLYCFKDLFGYFFIF